MTYIEWQSALSAFRKGVGRVKKLLIKLKKYNEKDRRQYDLLLPEVQVEVACLIKIYELLDEHRHWHMDKIGLAAWKQFDEFAKSLFSTIDKIVPQGR